MQQEVADNPGSVDSQRSQMGSKRQKDRTGRGTAMKEGTYGSTRSETKFVVSLRSSQ